MIDSGEKYPYRFSGQQATTVRERLACGDYAVQVAGNVVAAVERKTTNDLISSMISGRMRFLMAELAALPRAAVVVEEGYSKIFKHPHVAGSVAAERLAEIQAQFPPCRSCSARPDRSPRNGPIAGLVHASTNSSSKRARRRWKRASATPWTRTPPRHRFSRSRLLSGRGRGKPDWLCQTGDGFHPISGGLGRSPSRALERSVNWVSEVRRLLSCQVAAVQIMASWVAGRVS